MPEHLFPLHRFCPMDRMALFAAQVPAFYTVTTASKHDSTAMSSIHYEPNVFYIFDRAYGSFKKLYKIHLKDSFYVVRAKTNLKYKIVKWKRRMPKNVRSDAEIKLTGYLSEKKYPESFRIVRYYYPNSWVLGYFFIILVTLAIIELFRLVFPKRVWKYLGI